MTDHIEKYREYHKNRSERATRMTALVDQIEALCVERDYDSVIDYGCGNARQFSTFLPLELEVYDYDPGMPGCEERPPRADVVVCNHMLEHVENEDQAMAVIEDIKALTKHFAYIAVSLEESTKLLPDGTPWHTLVRPRVWWDATFIHFFGKRADEWNEKEVILKWNRSE
jgi:hypothetical protein